MSRETQSQNLSRQEQRQRRNELSQKLRDRSEEEKNRIDSDYQKKQRQMVRVAMALSRISPTSSMVYASMAMARTGIAEYDRFISNVKDYQVAFRRFFGDFEREQSRRERQGRSDGTNASVVEDFSGFPEFRSSSTPLADSVREVMIDGALLILFVVAFFMGSYVSFLRYPIAG